MSRKTQCHRDGAPLGAFYLALCAVSPGHMARLRPNSAAKSVGCEETWGPVAYIGWRYRRSGGSLASRNDVHHLDRAKVQAACKSLRRGAETPKITPDIRVSRAHIEKLWLKSAVNTVAYGISSKLISGRDGSPVLGGGA